MIHRHRRIAALIAGVVAVALVLVVVVTMTPHHNNPVGGTAGKPGSGSATADSAKTYPRIYSATLNIDLAVKPGDGTSPPVQPIAFQYPNTAPLERAITEPGNTYLYAHDRAGMFLGLHHAHVGDVIVIALSPSSQEYFQITELHERVAWNDLSFIHKTNDNRLTLQTCDGVADQDPRYVVVTKRVSDATGRAAARTS